MEVELLVPQYGTIISGFSESCAARLHDMPSSDTKALPSTTPESQSEEVKPKCKACCACPETKQVRDACIMENGEADCQALIEAHKQSSSSSPRVLSEEELLQLARHDSRPVTDFKRRQLRNESGNWDKFYQRNADRFFKDRHWTTREFAELSTEAPLKLLEVGCGVGNLFLPLLEENPSVYVYACDFAPTAISIIQADPNYRKHSDRCQCFVADITKDDLTSNIPETLDIVTLIFVLSAIHPEKMVAAVRNLRKVLRPGGLVLFRDYGLYDHAMIRFAPGHKLDEKFYFRQDCTYTYYFSLEDVQRIFTEAGFALEECDYVHKETSNQKLNLHVPRIFVQGKFRNPA
ncbi:Methyltransferase-like protein 6 [Hypsibius exemplaris]|uniref:Methyltransferase-like protein 6 n=1 Tax=Hypsibius exemplaris TaxID=2072580 RepID=A0A1W0WHG7_HYPEX|nr:Methyltransferase-like protein 6 [Hypsibius exemplaris]